MFTLVRNTFRSFEPNGFETTNKLRSTRIAKIVKSTIQIPINNDEDYDLQYARTNADEDIFNSYMNISDSIDTIYDGDIKK